jgi:hypothetical protein
MWFLYRSIVIIQVPTFQKFAALVRVMFKKFLSFSRKHNSLFRVSQCLPQCMTCTIDILITYFKLRSVKSFIEVDCKHHTVHDDIQKEM